MVFRTHAFGPCLLTNGTRQKPIFLNPKAARHLWRLYLCASAGTTRISGHAPCFGGVRIAGYERTAGTCRGGAIKLKDMSDPVPQNVQIFLTGQVYHLGPDNMWLSGAVDAARINDEIRVLFDQVVIKRIMVGRQNNRILFRQNLLG